MKHLICSIQDKAVSAFGRPFVTRTENEAIRITEMEVNRQAEGNMLNTHPNDYALYTVGFWDDETGTVTGLNEPPIRLIEAALLKKD